MEVTAQRVGQDRLEGSWGEEFVWTRITEGPQIGLQCALRLRLRLRLRLSDADVPGDVARHCGRTDGVG